MDKYFTIKGRPVGVTVVCVEDYVECNKFIFIYMFFEILGLVREAKCVSVQYKFEVVQFAISILCIFVGTSRLPFANL